MSDNAIVVSACSPVRLSRIVQEVSPGSTVAEVVRRVLPDVDAHVRLNGADISPARAACVLVAPGDLIEVRAVPTGGARNILRTILMIAVVAGAGVLGAKLAASWGISSAVGIAVVKGVVTAVGLLALNAIVPPPRPDLPRLSGTDGAESLTYGIAGARNTLAPFGSVPCVLGFHRMTPPYGAQPYTELVGGKQYLRLLFCFGYGPLDVTDIKIGDTAIGSFDGVETELIDGAAGAAALTLFPDTVTQDVLAVALTYAASWQSRTTAADTDEISIDVEFPAGLYELDAAGNRTLRQVEFEIQYRESTAPGAWIDVDTDQRYIKTLTVVSGSATNGSGTLTFTGGGGSGAAGTYINPVVGNLRVTLTNGGRGYTSAPTIGFSGTAQPGASVTATLSSGFAANEATAQPVRIGHRWKPAARGTYDVRIRRITADATGTLVSDLATWTALRSIQNEDPISQARMCKLALRIKATDQLNGIVDELNALAKTECLDWDGATWTVAATNNPASLFRYLLQGPMNARPVADARIDLDALADWHEACDLAGYTCNVILDTDGTLWDRLRTVASCGRAAPSYYNGIFSVVRDIVRATRVQLFTPRNSRGFEASTAAHERPHGFRVRFIDEDTGYVQGERIVYDDGYTSANAEIFEEISLLGVTDSDQVWKTARYMLACQRLRPTIYQLETDLEHLVCTRGDRVGVQHDAALAGVAAARIVQATADVLTLDEEIEMEAGTDYGVLGRSSAGAITQWNVVCEPGRQRTIRRDPAAAVFDLVPGDLVALGERTTEVLDCLVQGIEPMPDFGARLTLIDYSPDVYTADSGAIPPYSPPVWVPSDLRPVVAPTSLATTEYLYQVAGVLRFGVTLSWLHGDDNRLPGLYDVQIRYPGDAWVGAGQTTGDRIDIPDTTSGVYSFRVRAVSGIRSSDWVTLEDVALAVLDTPPPDVVGLHLVYSAGRALLVWDAVDDPRIVRYEVRIGTVWETAAVAAVVSDAFYEPTQAGTYMVKALALTAYSETAADAIVAGVGLVVNVVATLDQAPTWPGLLGVPLTGPTQPIPWKVVYEADWLLLPENSRPVWTPSGELSYAIQTQDDGPALTISGHATPGFSRTFIQYILPSPHTGFMTEDLWVWARVAVKPGTVSGKAGMYVDNGTNKLTIDVWDGFVSVDDDDGTAIATTTLPCHLIVRLGADGSVDLWLHGVLVRSSNAVFGGSGVPKVQFGALASGDAGSRSYWYGIAVEPTTISTHGRAVLHGYAGTSATYWIDSGDIVDLGYEAACDLTAEVGAFGYSDSYDLLTIAELLDEDDLLGHVDTFSVTPYVRTAGDDAIYGEWAPIVSGAYYAQYFDFKAVFECEEGTSIVCETLKFTVDMPDRIDEGSESMDAGGSSITFDPAFQAAPNVVAAIIDGAGTDTLKVENVTTTGFDARAYDSGGNGVARDIHWIAKGY